MSPNDAVSEHMGWRRATLLALLLIAPCVTAVLSAAILFDVASGHDQVFRQEPLPMDLPLSLTAQTEGEAMARVYELLARGIGPNDPIPYRHPVTTEGQVREVGLLFIAAASSDRDLLHLLVAKGADLSHPINAIAVCAAVMADKPHVLRALLEDLGADPNPEPRCNQNRDSPLALARRLPEPRILEILLAKGGRDD